jgi:proteasome lid subunit RPN8/RPN11
MIILKSRDRGAILRHGEADYPYECCGLLIGRFDGERKIVESIWPISNAREEASQRNRFLITADEFAGGERRAKEQGLDVVGFYHSHPDHPAQASHYDCEHAWPIFSYIIVSVVQGKASDLLSWQLEDDRSGFRSETIVQGA